jgi:hypothetical protein
VVSTIVSERLAPPALQDHDIFAQEGERPEAVTRGKRCMELLDN